MLFTNYNYNYIQNLHAKLSRCTEFLAKFAKELKNLSQNKLTPLPVLSGLFVTSKTSLTLKVIIFTNFGSAQNCRPELPNSKLSLGAESKKRRTFPCRTEVE